jgi:hypothetical protein
MISVGSNLSYYIAEAWFRHPEQGAIEKADSLAKALRRKGLLRNIKRILSLNKYDLNILDHILRPLSRADVFFLALLATFDGYSYVSVSQPMPT